MFYTLALASAVFFAAESPRVSRSPISITSLALAPCSDVHGNAADLAVLAKLTPTRFVSYTVANCSSVATPSGFQVAIYINGSLKETIQHVPLPARGRQTVIGGEAGLQDCKPGEVKVVVDSANAIVEADETNNVFIKQMAPPCPDVAPHISQDVTDYGLKYRVEIKVVNDGTAVMPVVAVQTVGIPDTHKPGSHPPSADQCLQDPRLQASGDCFVDRTTVGPLGPGEGKTYHPGGKQLRTTTTFVKVTIMCNASADQCTQSNTNNDVATRVLGPH